MGVVGVAVPFERRWRFAGGPSGVEGAEGAEAAARCMNWIEFSQGNWRECGMGYPTFMVSSREDMILSGFAGGTMTADISVASTASFGLLVVRSSRPKCVLLQDVQSNARAVDRTRPHKKSQFP